MSDNAFGISEESLAAVEEAKQPGVFSIENLLAGAAYPKETVTVFLDADAVNELTKLRSAREQLELSTKKTKAQRTIAGDDSSKELEALNFQIEQLDAQVEQSALTFVLQGMSPAKVDEINERFFTDRTKNYTNTPEEDARDLELIAKSIIKIENANGDIDPNPATPELIAKFKGTLLGDEYLRLVRGVAHVNLNGKLFDQATDASFLSRRSNMAR